MKTFLFAALALTACTVSAPAITVTTPANGAQVTSPFLLVASTTTCGSASAVSMGYAIDSGASVIEPTSFSTYVSASAGTHVLHVKCWGKQVNSQVLLNINVATGHRHIEHYRHHPGEWGNGDFAVSADRKRNHLRFPTCGLLGLLH